MVEASSSTTETQRPSHQRRQELREGAAAESNIPTVSSFFPLERYYDASDKVLETFEAAFAKKSLDEAYVYGIRYSTFCVKGIPTHDYYHSSRFERRRIETQKRVIQVMDKLELVAMWMDEEETIKMARRKALIEKQRKERERIQKEKEARQMKELEERIARQKEAWLSTSSTSTSNGGASATATTNGNVEESALAKLQRLSQPIPPPMPPTTEAIPPPKRVSFSDNTIGGDGSAVQPLPPPLLPPSDDDDDDDYDEDGDANMHMNGTATTENGVVPAPPAYHQILGESKNYFGQNKPVRNNNNNYAPPAAASTSVISAPSPDPALPSYDAIMKQQQQQQHQKPKQQQQQPQKKKKKSPVSRDIRQHVQNCRRLHLQYQQERQILISPLKTYQGRVGGSTNGCTVISACVVSKHLETHGGVTDAQIVNVIDRDCVPLLRNIRSKLGLTGGALIIPSDVHDHLVDHKWLYQHKFAGAAGGNILDPDHLGELLKLLAGNPQDKTQHLKAAATLFFREHVISIVKFPTSPTEAIYDFVDSLPTVNGGASRTRCASLQALKVHLEKYTTNKLSDSNCSYIERNKWDDSMADFDPRVFQAFVWADLPKPKG